ncbi:MAG: hypothetical protein KBT53_06500 [Porticoccus sp.]|nr:hypothetical protein [Porticoccus sp.]MBQ0807595.1 hypothetical protein [Porticoccus sp.]
MKFFTQIVVLFLLSSLHAWAIEDKETTIDWGSSEGIKSHVILTLEPKKGEVASGPNFANSDKIFSDHFSEIYLVRSTSLDEDEHYTLYVTALYADDGWRDYTSATAGGDNVSLALLSKTAPSCNDKTTCKYEERLAISLNFFDVVDGLSSGLDVKLTGNRTDHIKIPGNYFRAVMQTIRVD